MDTNALYRYANRRGIVIDDGFVLDKVKAASCKLDDEQCVVALHRSLSAAEYRERLAHELGHCATDAFYDPTVPIWSRQKCENKAIRWQAKRLMPWRSVEKAFRQGCVEAWQLAEYFDVSEEFVRKAIALYKQEGKTIN